MANAAHVLAQVLREHVVEYVLAVSPTIAQQLSSVVASNPSLSVSEILTRVDVVTTINTAITTARTQIESELRAGHSAAALLGDQISRKEFAALGEALPTPDRAPSTAYLASILNDVQRMTHEFAEDLGSRMAEIFVATKAPPNSSNAHYALGQARAARIPDVVERVTRRLAARARASASVLPIRTIAETQLGYYQAFSGQHPGMRLAKRWQTTSVKPCPACVALNGITIPLHVEFPRFLSAASGFTLPKVYFDLQGPPRHPQCRCKLLLVIEPEDEELIQALNGPVPYAEMTAEQVREMPLTKYQAFISFIRSVMKVARKLYLRRRRRG